MKLTKKKIKNIIIYLDLVIAVFGPVFLISPSFELAILWLALIALIFVSYFIWCFKMDQMLSKTMNLNK